jgi:hypothetical protein
VPIRGEAGAHYKGSMCPLEGGQVPITGGSGAHYRGRTPVAGGQVPVGGALEERQVKHYEVERESSGRGTRSLGEERAFGLSASEIAPLAPLSERAFGLSVLALCSARDSPGFAARS